MAKKHGPWIIEKSEIKYQNPWLELTEDKVIKPDGKPGIFGFVKMRAGVSVLPIDDQGFVYLTKEFRYAIGGDSIEVVSGGINDNEDDLAAAKRELGEETGIEASEWVDLGEMNPFTSSIFSPAKLFLAKKLVFGNAEPDSTELIETIKIKMEEAVQLVMDSKITHGQSCVLILKAARYLGL